MFTRLSSQYKLLLMNDNARGLFISHCNFSHWILHVEENILWFDLLMCLFSIQILLLCCWRCRWCRFRCNNNRFKWIHFYIIWIYFVYGLSGASFFENCNVCTLCTLFLSTWRIGRCSSNIAAIAKTICHSYRTSALFWNARQAFNCDLLLAICHRVIFSLVSRFVFFIALSTFVIRRIRFIHRNQIVATNCSATCHCWPIQVLLNSHRKLDWLRSVHPMMTSIGLQLYVWSHWPEFEFVVKFCVFSISIVLSCIFLPSNSVYAVKVMAHSKFMGPVFCRPLLSCNTPSQHRRKLSASIPRWRSKRNASSHRIRMHIITLILSKRLKNACGKKFNQNWQAFLNINISSFFSLHSAFAETIQRPFGVKYNPYTQTVEVLSSAKRITAAVSELRGDLSIVSAALRKVSALDQDLDVEKITQMLQAGLQVSHQ